MAELFKFPHTPHVAWLGSGNPRGDKVLPPEEAGAFLAGEVVVEEKVDGANVGISVDERGRLQAQSRGNFLGRGSHPQFEPLWPWLAARQETLVGRLGDTLILFGEWCFAVHSVRYSRLPDWFLGIDVYDRAAGRFWSTTRRNALLESLQIPAIPEIARGRFGVADLRALMGESRVGDAPMEGLYLRQEGPEWLIARAKLVRPEFVQAISEHWSGRPLERNQLARS